MSPGRDKTPQERRFLYVKFVTRHILTGRKRKRNRVITSHPKGGLWKQRCVGRAGAAPGAGCCFFPSPAHRRSLVPGLSIPSSPQGQLGAAVISALRSSGLSSPGRPDADHACRASINYSTDEHGRQRGRHQLLQ